jgi:hypothetical protein
VVEQLGAGIGSEPSPDATRRPTCPELLKPISATHLATSWSIRGLLPV